MEENTQVRIVRKEESHWIIRTGGNNLLKLEEREKLKEYLNGIRFPYRDVNGEIQIPDKVAWSAIHECLGHFYDGIADVTRPLELWKA